MCVIDQHAAHERVMFEKLRAATDAKPALSQALLLPLQIHVTPLEASAAAEHRNTLIKYGLDADSFGPRQVRVSAIPAGLDAKRAEQMVRDALTELADQGKAHSLDERLDALCARLACHAAVRAGDHLAADAIKSLLQQLDAIDFGAHCPHGRPVARTVRMSDLAGWFHRT